MGDVNQTATYTVSRGKLLFMIDGSAGFRDLGNCTDLSITSKTDTLDHYSMRGGVAVKDKQVVLKQELTGKFKLDEMTPANINLFLMGSGAITVPQTSGALVAAPYTALKDKWIDLGKRKLSAVVVSKNTSTYTAEVMDTGDGTTTIFGGTLINFPVANGTLTIHHTVGGLPKTAIDNGSGVITGSNIASGSIVYSTGVWAITFTVAPDNLINITADYAVGVSTYLKGSDYEVDTEAGLLYTLTGGTITDLSTIRVSATYAMLDVVTVAAATTTTTKGHILFVSSPATGAVTDYYGYGSLKPDGDLGLITDKWGEMGFGVEFLSHPSYTGLLMARSRGTV